MRQDEVDYFAGLLKIEKIKERKIRELIFDLVAAENSRHGKVITTLIRVPYEDYDRIRMLYRPVNETGVDFSSGGKWSIYGIALEGWQGDYVQLLTESSLVIPA